MSDNVQLIIADFQDRQDKVQRNKNYSNEGVNAALKKLKSEKAEILKAQMPGLRKQAMEAAIEADRLAMCENAARSEQTDRLDYARLSYQADKVKSAISVNPKDEDVLLLWDGVKSRSDKYEMQAWVDVAPGLIQLPNENISPQYYNELLDDIAGHKDAAINTPEIDQFVADKNTAVYELKNVQSTAALIDQETNSAGTQSKVMRGIRFSDAGELQLSFKHTNKELAEIEETIHQSDDAVLAPYLEQALKIGVVLDEGEQGQILADHEAMQ